MCPRRDAPQAKCRGILYPPWSSFRSGKSARPENTVGIPMTRPEKVDVPPRNWAYALDEDTIMKKEI